MFSLQKIFKVITYTLCLIFLVACGSKPSTNTSPPENPPTGLSFVIDPATPSQAILSWEAVSGATTYGIYKLCHEEPLEASQPGRYRTAAIHQNSYTHSIQRGLTCYFHVVAENSGGDSSNSEAVYLTFAPDVPIDFQITSVGINEIHLYWSDQLGATTYNVYFSNEPDINSSGTHFSTIGSSYTHQNLPIGETYYYAINSENSGGSSDLSTIIIATITPQTPENFSVTQSISGEVELSWDDVLEASTYHVYVEHSETQSHFSTTENTYLHQSLTVGDSYLYYVTAESLGTESEASTMIQVIIFPAAPENPAANLMVEVGDAALINWDNVDGASTYTVYFSQTPNVSTASANHVSTSANSYQHNELLAGTTYYYVITAKNDGGESLISSEVSITIPPDSPLDLAVSQLESRAFTITWSMVTGASTYHLHYTTSDSTGSISSTMNTYVHSNLEVGEAYAYQVTAENSGGESTRSQTESQTVVPDAPTLTIAQNSDTLEVVASWVESEGTSTYHLYYSDTYGGNTGVLLVSTNALSYTHTDLVPGETYYYVATAENEGGPSFDSNISETTFAPQAPSNLTAKQSLPETIQIRWQESTGTTTHHVYASTSLDPDDNNSWQRLDSVSGRNMYTQSGVSTNTTYYYSIIAENAGGNSTRSSIVSATLTYAEVLSTFDDPDTGIHLASVYSLETSTIGDEHYLFASAEEGVTVFSVSEDGRLNHIESVIDNTIPMQWAADLETVGIGSDTYLFVTSDGQQRGVSIFSVSSSGNLSHTDSFLSDNDQLIALNSIDSSDGHTYILVTNLIESTSNISVFEVSDSGSLVPIEHNDDLSVTETDTSILMETIPVENTNYLLLANRPRSGNHSLKVFGVSDEGEFSTISRLEVTFQIVSMDFLSVEDNTLVFVETGDSTVEIFSFSSTGSLTHLNQTTISDLNALKTMIVDDSPYLIASLGGSSDSLMTFEISTSGALMQIDSIADTEDPELFLDNVKNLETLTIDDHYYVFNSNYTFSSDNNYGDGISVFSISGGVLSNTDNIRDLKPNLKGATSVKGAEIDGRHYLFVAGNESVGVYPVTSTGTVTNQIDQVLDRDDPNLLLLGAKDLSIATVDSTNYLLVGSDEDNGISVFSISSSGTLSNTHNNNFNQLGEVSSVITQQIVDTTFIFASSFDNSAVNVFSLSDQGTLDLIYTLTDANGEYNIGGAIDLAIQEIDANFYLFVAGRTDSGVSVFSISDNGTLSHTDSVVNNDDRALSHPISLTTQSSGGINYLIVASYNSPVFGDNGMSVFTISNEGALSYHSTEYNHIETNSLSGIQAIESATINSESYLLISQKSGWDGLSVYQMPESIDDEFTYIAKALYSDVDPHGITSAVIDEETYIFILINDTLKTIQLHN